jgi:hypothetical protein
MRKLSGWWCSLTIVFLFSCTKTDVTRPQQINDSPAVEIKSFTATADNGKVSIQFSTSLQQNLQYFEIFSGSSGNQLCVITQIPVQNSLKGQITNYSFEDLNPKGNPTYYMLAYVGTDSTVQYDSQLLNVPVPGQ